MVKMGESVESGWSGRRLKSSRSLMRSIERMERRVEEMGVKPYGGAAE